MEHRAGPILANRSLSALIVASFVLSAFAGLYMVTSPSPSAAQPIGDLIVTSGTYTIENIDQPVDGDVEVTGGELIVRNGALMVISNVGSPRTVTVGSGGTLTLEHGVLTSYLDQIDPWPFLTLTIDGGTVVASSQSVLKFPGYITIQNGGSLVLYDSAVEPLSEGDLAAYVGGSALITADSADDGPAINVISSTVELYDSSITSLPEYPSDGQVASNLTLTGDSSLLAVNSYIDVDFGPAGDIDDWYTHNMLVLEDSSIANLYGAYFEPYVGVYSSRAPAVSANGESYFALPATKAIEDNTGQPIGDLWASDDGNVYHVDPGETLSIETFSAGAPATINAATLYIRYSVGSTYNGAGSFQWRLDSGTYASTGIIPDASETTYVDKSFDLYAAGVTTTSQIATLDVSFVNDGSSGSVGVDSMSIIITIGPEAYVYRWTDITVGDEYGVPIPDCEISAIFTGSSSYEGQPSFYFTDDGISPTPPDSVLNYMAIDASSFGVTGSMGVAQIPLLTDIISGGEYPNSLFVGTFELTGTVEQDSVVYSSTEAFSFPAYPAMTADDQHFAVTVDVEGISAESPDSSRWLVVPPDLLIEDMDYYHAGDVIVASDGTLTLLNALFSVVQTVANEHTIYVDGTANLVIEDSMLVSALPVDLIVKGSGTLEVKDSELRGVNIIAMENAIVKLDGASFDGLMTTSWDSEARIMIYDSVLTQSPELSGSTICEITNTSAPSIIVLDDATALLYRWIHITVFDGGDYPLEGADVYARFYVNETFWTSSSTDPTGVARLKSLGTILTSSGSTYVGQYRVNASYWSDGVEHVSDSEVSISVLPYTQPLTENATFAVLTISSVLLPDLSVVSNEIFTDPEDVVLNTECILSARIWNYGETMATDTSVDFLVGELLASAVLIDTTVIDTIAAGSFRDAFVSWTPDVTGKHTIWVVVNGGPDFDERAFNNNNASVEVVVLNYADLYMYPVEFYLVGGVDADDSFAGGEDITVSAYLYNVGEAPVTNIYVRMTVIDNGTASYDDLIVTETLEKNDRSLVSFQYTLPVKEQNTNISFGLSANPALSIPETSYANNNASAVLTVLDVRADFSVSAEDVYIQYGADDNVVPVYGNTVTIFATIYNEGGTDPGEINVSFGFVGQSTAFAIKNVSIPAGHSTIVEVPYLITITDGDSYTIYVDVDCNDSYWEKNELNNYLEFEFEVIQLEVDISVTVSSVEYEAGDTMVITVLVYYRDSLAVPVKYLRGVSVELVPPDGGQPVAMSTEDVYTNDIGAASFNLDIPLTSESGTYSVICRIAGLEETTTVTVEVHGTVSGGGIPLLVWIVVIAAIAAVVIGFTAYTYIYGLGKLVECGECGEFIPAASKRCPKCGVEFEVGTMKCSECGAWVPAESTECPNCGVKFVGEEIGEEDYLEKMRKEYDEMVSKYRELAKAELGKKFSDKAFEQWWIAQPTYISFDDWLAKEEEKRKEVPVACPVCGTLNPKEATVCNKCGTVFAAAAVSSSERRPPQSPPGAGPEAAQPAQPQYAQQPAEPAPQQQPAPRMVIRRPIDRKVVPKKVIRTPVSGQGEGDGQNGENQ